MKLGRVHWFLPDELDEDQLVYYNELVNGPRSRGASPSKLRDEQGRLSGAFNARLLDPKVGNAIQRLGAALRFESRLEPREYEIAILEVAYCERCDYEWHGHAQRAREAGLEEADLEAIRTGAEAPGLSERESMIRRVVDCLVQTRDLPDEVFTAAEQQLGQTKLFDVISVVGHYQHTALAIRAWRVPLREGRLPVFT